MDRIQSYCFALSNWVGLVAADVHRTNAVNEGRCVGSMSSLFILRCVCTAPTSTRSNFEKRIFNER